MEKKLHRRIVSALSIIPLILALSVPAFAATDNMDQMGDEVFQWYKLIRYCAVLFMIISLAAAGFRFASRAFVQSMKYSTDDIIMQIITSTIAFFVLMLLPTIIGTARNFLEGTGWQPGDFPSSGTVPEDDLGLGDWLEKIFGH